MLFVFYEVAQPRFILFRQVWDPVDVMFLCKTPSDKTFELRWKLYIYTYKAWDGLKQKWIILCQVRLAAKLEKHIAL